MKFPSITQIIEQTFKTFLRFPFAIIVAFFGTFISISLIERNESYDQNLYLNLLHTCFIGIVWFIAIDLFSEFKKYNFTKKLIIRITGAVFLIAYYFLLPVPFINIHIYRGLLIIIGLHLLVSFVAFIGKDKQKSFWFFNQELFIRASISVVYSAILYIGIAVAVGAASYLFDLGIKEDFYFKLWIFIVGIFITLVFLSGVPENFEQENENFQYPILLKILAQYILLPLVTIYLAILYIYSIGIIVKWELPEGIISYMVLAFSIVGIFSLLLIYPLQDSEKHGWIKIYAKWFYVALIPLIILLFISIGIRISNYGITENRYFIVALAIWLLGISLYMLITKGKNIKIIPISLAIIAFLAGIGPLSAFNISKISQLKRLEKLLIENKILVNGEIIKQNSLNYEIYNNIESIVNYINSTHGYTPFKKYLNPEKLDSIYVANNKGDIKWEILDMFGVETNSNDSYSENSGYFYYNSNNTEATVAEIKGYDYLLKFEKYFYEDEPAFVQTYKLSENKNLILEIDPIKNILQLNGDSIKFDVSLKNILDTINSKYGNLTQYNLPKDDLTVFDENENIKIKIVFNVFEGRKMTDNKLFISNLNGEIYFTIK